MFLITYVVAVLAVGFSVIAFAILLSKKGYLSLVFSGYMLSAAMWMGANTAADVASTPYALILFSALALDGAMLNVVFFVLLIDYLIDGRLPSVPRTLAYLTPSLGVIMFSGTHYAIRDMHFPSGEIAQTIPGNLYSFALILTLASLAYGVVRIAGELLRNRNRDQGSKFIHILVGLCLTTLGGLVFSVILPLVGEVRFYSLGAASCIFFAIPTAYAVFKQKLLNFKFVVQLGVIYGVLVGIIILFYLCLIQLLHYFLAAHLGLANFLGALATTIFGITTAPFIESYFRKITDHIFFKDRYVYSVAMHNLTTVLYTYVEFEDLVRESENALRATFRASNVTIRFTHTKSIETEQEDVLRIPILLEGLRIGSIHLGRKLSGDSYTSEDEQLIQTFAYQAATALSRALLHAESKRHTAELEAKVTERTMEVMRAYERERQVINDISHKLQTPLTIAQTKIDRLKPSLANNLALDSLENSLAEVSKFIYDLLSLARLDSEANTRTLDFVSISSFINDLAEEIGIIAGDYNIQVRKNITPDLRALINPEQMRDAIMSLASNSIKYIGSGKEKTIFITLERRGDLLAIVVQDNGLGISEADLPFVFNRFFRGANVLNKIEGTGIGLSITQCITENHRGKVRISSTLSKGTRVEILLPIAC